MQKAIPTKPLTYTSNTQPPFSHSNGRTFDMTCKPIFVQWRDSTLSYTTHKNKVYRYTSTMSDLTLY